MKTSLMENMFGLRPGLYFPAEVNFILRDCKKGVATFGNDFAALDERDCLTTVFTVMYLII